MEAFRKVFEITAMTVKRNKFTGYYTFLYLFSNGTVP